MPHSEWGRVCGWTAAWCVGDHHLSRGLFIEPPARVPIMPTAGQAQVSVHIRPTTISERNLKDFMHGISTDYVDHEIINPLMWITNIISIINIQPIIIEISIISNNLPLGLYINLEDYIPETLGAQLYVIHFRLPLQSGPSYVPTRNHHSFRHLYYLG